MAARLQVPAVGNLPGPFKRKNAPLPLPLRSVGWPPVRTSLRDCSASRISCSLRSSSGQQARRIRQALLLALDELPALVDGLLIAIQFPRALQKLALWFSPDSAAYSASSRHPPSDWRAVSGSFTCCFLCWHRSCAADGILPRGQIDRISVPAPVPSQPRTAVLQAAAEPAFLHAQSEFLQPAQLLAQAVVSARLCGLPAQRVQLAGYLTDNVVTRSRFC